MSDTPPIDSPIEPTATPPIASPSRPPATPKRPTWQWAVLVLGVSLVGGCTVLAALGAIMDSTLTHDLITTNFAASATPFHVGTHGQYRYSQSPGAYRITSTEVPDSPGASVGEYERVAYDVDTTMTVERVTGENSTVLVGCFDNKDRGYELIVRPDGVGLGRVNANSGRMLTSVGRSSMPATPFTMRLSCSDPQDGDIHVTGFVDGVEVVDAVDEKGSSDWMNATIGFMPLTAGETLEVSRLTARVPGS